MIRALLIPILQTVILLACIVCVTLLGDAGIIDVPAITAIVGAIVGSVGVLVGVAITSHAAGQRHQNGRSTDSRNPDA